MYFMIILEVLNNHVICPLPYFAPHDMAAQVPNLRYVVLALAFSFGRPPSVINQFFKDWAIA